MDDITDILGLDSSSAGICKYDEEDVLKGRTLNTLGVAVLVDTDKDTVVQGEGKVFSGGSTVVMRGVKNNLTSVTVLSAGGKVVTGVIVCRFLVTYAEIALSFAELIAAPKLVLTGDIFDVAGLR